jgi:hypothetical protein
VSRPFESGESGIRLALGHDEIGVLRSVPTLLEIGGKADGRLNYTPYPDDPDAAERYRELVGDDLNDLRKADHSEFVAMLSGEPVSAEAVEAFMRVVGEARLVLASRLGITDDGWEAELERGNDPELALLGWLGYLQDAAVETLSDLL